MRVGVDIGGTFTDVVVFDEQSDSIMLGKALSTHDELVRGVEDGLHKAAIRLSEASSLIHGSTIVVNSIMERNGAKTALITTKGFRDVYEIGRGNRPDSFNLRFKKHRPLVPRDLVFEVEERMLADGTEHLPLNEDRAREVVAILREEGVEAVAILFLHSYRSPEHEIRMAQILKEEMPELYVTPSHEVSREYREYERTSTAAANAYVGPKVSTYLSELETRLSDSGFAGDLLIMQSNGGLTNVETARHQCIQMMESGPAGGVVGTMALCDALDVEAAISFDMGGTTAKACVIRRGEPTMSADYFFGGYNEGLAIRIPVLDIVEVGTGGGSIGWIDEGGGLHVGPQSAGAQPGPVSYGRGGTEPTVTDADVVLGHLSPAAFLGGEMRLDGRAAEEALRMKVAAPLGMTMERAASGMIEIATASMANAVRQVTLERGLDPRDFTLFAYGGGGPLYASAVARELAIGTVIVPQAPGHFSALGMLLADLRRDFVQTIFARLQEIDMTELEAQFHALEEQAREALAGSGIGTEDIVFERAADMRYVGQEHAVAVRFPSYVGDVGSRERIKQLFDQAHELRYSHSAPEERADIVTLRVTAIGRLAKPGLPKIDAGEARPVSSAELGTRAVVMGEEGTVNATVYDREQLLGGNVIVGPAVVEERASTTVVYPRDRLTVNEFGHLVIEVAGSES